MVNSKDCLSNYKSKYGFANTVVNTFIKYGFYMTVLKKLYLISKIPLLIFYIVV